MQTPQMMPYGDNFIPLIKTEDEILHTQAHPFCFLDPGCPCHEDPLLIAEVAQAVTDGLLTNDEATEFVKGRIL